jgi:hypothetical protein
VRERGERQTETERKYTANVQCSVQYILLLLYLMLINILLCVIYQLTFTVFTHVTRISRHMTLYIVFGIIRGLP